MTIRRGLHRFAWFAHPIHDIPQRLGVAILIRRGGFRAQHGGTVHHRGVHVLRDQDGHVAGRSHEFHQDAVLTLGAGHEDGFDLVAGLVHGLDDLVGLQGDEFHGGVVVERQPVDGLVRGEADGGTRHARVGDRGAVAEEVAVEEEVAAQVGDAGGFGFGLHVLEVLIQVVVDVGVVGVGNGHGVLEGWVGFEDVLEELTGGRLAALGHPVARDEDVTIGAPDALDEDRFGGHGDVAGGGPGDGGYTGESLVSVVAGVIGAQGGLFEIDLGADGADPSCIGVDDPTSYCNAGW